MGIFIFLLTCYGITNILVFGSIFEWWRSFWTKFNPSFFGKLFTCPMCLSMWVGSVLSYILIDYDFMTPWSLMTTPNEYVSMFLNGCISSGFVWVLHTIQEWFERGNYDKTE